MCSLAAEFVAQKIGLIIAERNSTPAMNKINIQVSQSNSVAADKWRCFAAINRALNAYFRSLAIVV